MSQDLNLAFAKKKTTLGTTTNKQNSDWGELECSPTNYLLNLRYSHVQVELQQQNTVPNPYYFYEDKVYHHSLVMAK